MSMENFNHTTGNRTCDLPACSAVPQPTARAPRVIGTYWHTDILFETEKKIQVFTGMLISSQCRRGDITKRCIYIYIYIHAHTHIRTSWWSLRAAHSTVTRILWRNCWNYEFWNGTLSIFCSSKLVSHNSRNAVDHEQSKDFASCFVCAWNAVFHKFAVSGQETIGV